MDLMVYEIERSDIFRKARRKIHIYDYDTDKVLCGLPNIGSSTFADVNEEWLNQPDPDKCLCSKCKKKALRILKQDILTK